MTHRVVFTPEAESQLLTLYRYLAAVASPDIARRFTEGIVDHCTSLAAFPLRGTPRDDIRPGLRTTPYRRRVTIAHAVSGEEVAILGIFYAGQDFSGGWSDEAV